MSRWSSFERNAAIRLGLRVGHRGVEADVDTMAAMRVMYLLRSILIAHPSQEAWQDFGHRDLEAELGGRCSYREPDQAAADNDKMLSRS